MPSIKNTGVPAGEKYLEPAMYQKGNNELLQEAEQWQHQKDSLVDFFE